MKKSKQVYNFDKSLHTNVSHLGGWQDFNNGNGEA